MTESSTHSPGQLNIVTWNILLDKTRTKNSIIKPQHERVKSDAKSLLELGVDLDVVMLQEAHHNNGQKIAELTGQDPGFWQQHNRKGEHIGVFGGAVESAEFHEIGNNRKIVIARVGGLAVFGIHFSARPKRYFKRINESQALCKLIDREEEVAVVGDFNGPRWEAARRMLARRGLVSAFSAADLARPGTYPTDAYRDIMWTPKQQLILPYQVSVDDILVRGLEVHDAASFVGDSDHVGLRVALAA